MRKFTLDTPCNLSIHLIHQIVKHLIKKPVTPWSSHEINLDSHANSKVMCKDLIGILYNNLKDTPLIHKIVNKLIEQSNHSLITSPLSSFKKPTSIVMLIL